MPAALLPLGVCKMRCKWRGERCHLPTEGGLLEPVIPSSPSLYRYTEAEEKRETGEKKEVTHVLHIPTSLQLHRCKYMRANTCTSLHTQTYTHHTGCRIQLGVVDKLVGLYPQSRRHQGKPVTLSCCHNGRGWASRVAAPTPEPMSVVYICV